MVGNTLNLHVFSALVSVENVIKFIAGNLLSSSMKLICNGMISSAAKMIIITK